MAEVLPTPALPVNGEGETPSPACGRGWEGERSGNPPMRIL